jgi:hypothetical protein
LIKGEKSRKNGAHLKELAQWCKIGLQNGGRIASG